MTGQYFEKTVVVTGASRGIGAEIAVELGRRGAHVILVARQHDRLLQIAEKIAKEGGRATAFSCNVTDEGSVRALADQLAAMPLALDMLVNNAGKEMMMPLQMMKPSAAREIFDLNVLAMANMIRVLLGLLKKGSAVVNMASVAGLRGEAGLSIYCASKAAVIALTRSLARELAGRGIRVNAVAPGMVKGEMTDRILGRLKPSQAAQLEAAHPLGFGNPRDVACSVAFLGSDDAAWITGHTLVVDGGYSA